MTSRSTTTLARRKCAGSTLAVSALAVALLAGCSSATSGGQAAATAPQQGSSSTTAAAPTSTPSATAVQPLTYTAHYRTARGYSATLAITEGPGQGTGPGDPGKVVVVYGSLNGSQVGDPASIVLTNTTPGDRPLTYSPVGAEPSVQLIWKLPAALAKSACANVTTQGMKPNCSQATMFSIMANAQMVPQAAEFAQTAWEIPAGQDYSFIPTGAPPSLVAGVGPLIANAVALDPQFDESLDSELSAIVDGRPSFVRVSLPGLIADGIATGFTCQSPQRYGQASYTIFDGRTGKALTYAQATRAGLCPQDYLPS